ncbi:MAG: LytTR family DNA-binding domain-containing protein [Prevotella sp.]|nr:LytTR family DNA-binding domain-containing protein [Prevotella sp.]
MIKCLAIDDEPLALKQLAAYIQKIPFLELAGQCQSALEARQIMEEDLIDAIFIDINMPDLSGMDFVKQLAAPPIVVFTTAYAEYAVEGYKVDAVDYLLKPFGLDEFRRAAQKVKKIYDLQNEQAPAETPAAAPEATISTVENADDSLFLKTEHRVVRITIADIRYIEGMSEYVKIYLEGQKPITVLLSMKKLEEQLPSYFMRVHRSYIINLNKVREVNKNRVIIAPEEEGGTAIYLPIGDLYRERFTEWVSKRLLGK